MSFKFYIHNLESGDNHFGCVFNRERIYIRDAEKYTFPRIDSMIDLSLKDTIEPSWDEIDKLIDEAYEQIGQLRDNMRYRKTTSNGEFEIIYRTGIWDTSKELKDDIRNRIKQLKQKLDNQKILKIA